LQIRTIFSVDGTLLPSAGYRQS